MDFLSAPEQMTSWVRKRVRQGKTVGLVPTMGALHEGHLSLIRKAREHADIVVVSIFVNQLQFGPQEDFGAYPRDLDRDLALVEQEGGQVVFAPSQKDMYPGKALTRVCVADITNNLCGAGRPGHFEGVATVVAKLFNIITPQVAVFGRKDLQQLAVVRQMVRDLNWPIEIIGQPIVRESDGLAMSSRNAYLDPGERQLALLLYRAIQFARRMAEDGEEKAAVAVSEVRGFLQDAGLSGIEYISIVDQYTMAEKEFLDDDSIIVLAALVGATRLIDNGFIFPKKIMGDTHDALYA